MIVDGCEMTSSLMHVKMAKSASGSAMPACILILTHRSISGAWSASDWVWAHGGNGALTQRACLRDACEDSTETLLRLP